MTRLYSDSGLRPLLRKELDSENYKKVDRVLKHAPTIESIPIKYIEYYAKKQDSTCADNLLNLIKQFKEDRPNGETTT